MVDFTKQLEDITNNLENFKLKYEKDVAVKKSLEEELIKVKNNYANVLLNLEDCLTADDILTKVSVDAKKYAVTFLESIVTDAIKYISEGTYEFKIDMPEGSNKCNFYIVETVDGVESLQEPESACGGGFVDIISTTLRYAYLNLYDKPKLNGPILLDEPGKMVSSGMSNKFANFIKKLSKDFDRQTIVITHNDSTMNVADNSIVIQK